MLDIFNIKTTKEAKRPLTIVVSKKYIKKSTKRNLLKRRACYAYNELVKQKPELKDKNTTLYIKKVIDNIPSYKKIKENICGIQ